MKNKGESVIAFDDITTQHRTCVLWNSKSGCRFSFNKRPKGGRELIPMYIPMEKCREVYTEEQAAIDWFPWQELMYDLYLYFYKNKI